MNLLEEDTSETVLHISLELATILWNTKPTRAKDVDRLRNTGNNKKIVGRIM